MALGYIGQLTILTLWSPLLTHDVVVSRACFASGVCRKFLNYLRQRIVAKRLVANSDWRAIASDRKLDNCGQAAIFRLSILGLRYRSCWAKLNRNSEDRSFHLLESQNRRPDP